jgi:uncharacterized protein YecT (DUF1311 family)
MKTFLPVLLLLAFLGAFPLSSAHAQTQAQMNQEAAAEFKKADAELNKVYPQVLAKLDAEGKDKLKAAQRAWVAFRDAQAELEADTARGGSMAPLLRATSMTQTTEDRVKQLKAFLKELSER